MIIKYFNKIFKIDSPAEKKRKLRRKRGLRKTFKYKTNQIVNSSSSTPIISITNAKTTTTTTPTSMNTASIIITTQTTSTKNYRRIYFNKRNFTLNSATEQTVPGKNLLKINNLTTETVETFMFREPRHNESDQERGPISKNVKTMPFKGITTTPTEVLPIRQLSTEFAVENCKKKNETRTNKMRTTPTYATHKSTETTAAALTLTKIKPATGTTITLSDGLTCIIVNEDDLKSLSAGEGMDTKYCIVDRNYEFSIELAFQTVNENEKGWKYLTESTRSTPRLTNFTATGLQANASNVNTTHKAIVEQVENFSYEKLDEGNHVVGEKPIVVEIKYKHSRNTTPKQPELADSYAESVFVSNRNNLYIVDKEIMQAQVNHIKKMSSLIEINEQTDEDCRDQATNNIANISNILIINKNRIQTKTNLANKWEIDTSQQNNQFQQISSLTFTEIIFICNRGNIYIISKGSSSHPDSQLNCPAPYSKTQIDKEVETKDNDKNSMCEDLQNNSVVTEKASLSTNTRAHGSSEWKTKAAKITDFKHTDQQSQVRLDNLSILIPKPPKSRTISSLFSTQEIVGPYNSVEPKLPLDIYYEAAFSQGVIVQAPDKKG